MFEIITMAARHDDPPVEPYVMIRLKSEQLMAPAEIDDFIRRLRSELDRMAESAKHDLAQAIANDPHRRR